ncbi:hypothetical protein [Dactylosporangium sp. CA-092794]|uniref:hypothetical protein n=1 Tax=Dactylosporangium sp. CA-092794 TaxID=3239929 RepID=UPI003D903B72
MTAPEGASALARAATWLRAYLREHGGEALAGDVLAAGKRAGHAERTLGRAANRIGVRKVPAPRWGGGSVWILQRGQDADDGGQRGQDRDEPDPEAAAGDAPVRPAVRVPVAHDIYGYPVEYVEVRDAAAASQWDERNWRRLDGL